MNFIFENKDDTSSFLSLSYKCIIAWLIQEKKYFPV